jgi:F-type H+-transporting ATPase subunit b
MKYQNIYLFIFTSLISISSYGAGKGSGSVKDLAFPAINFIILFGFIIYKYKNVISKNYSDESIRVENLLNDAAEADKQATLKLETLTEQLENIDSLKKDLKEKATEKLGAQLEQIKFESKNKIKKLEEDKENRYDQDKTNLVKRTNGKVLDMVINDAKNIVSSDKVRKRAAEQKLLGSIR